MKKTLFFMIILAVLATGCKKDKSKTLNYSGSSTVNIALRDYYKLPVSSEYDITYSTSNDLYVTVSADGTIYGKNVGNADITMSNGYESKTISVDVDLFIEPTFEFGCGTGRIRDLYGSPYQSMYIDDTTLVYQYTASQGYSYTCGEMDFFFDEGAYFEADLYIKKSVDYLLGLYLDENFIIDTVLSNDTLNVYRHKLDNEIICGKFDPHNIWEEWCLFYIRLEQNRSFANVLNRRPRSSKLRY